MTLTPHEIAAVDQCHAEVRDVVDNIIAEAGALDLVADDAWVELAALIAIAVDGIPAARAGAEYPAYAVAGELLCRLIERGSR